MQAVQSFKAIECSVLPSTDWEFIVPVTNSRRCARAVRQFRPCYEIKTQTVPSNDPGMIDKLVRGPFTTPMPPEKPGQINPPRPGIWPNSNRKKPSPLRCSGPGWRGGRTVARGSTLKGATGDAIVTRSVPRGMCRVDWARQKHLALPLRGG